MMSTRTSTQGWKVGELAKRTGLTVRTLHHYEEIGLLPPSERTQKGHRLYGPADVERLQKIVGMRQLGFSLDEIRRALDGGATLELVLDKQIQHMRQRIEMEQELCRRLEATRRLLRSTGEVSVDALMDAVELTMKIESHYSPEQLEYLKRRRAELGEARIKEVEAEWPKLIAAVRAEMERGTDPSSETMRKLAAQWAGLIREFTGGNEGVRQAASQALAAQIDQPGGFQGIDRELAEYVGRAIKAVKE
jgi:DNA-binding transcriptional MerR regulator